MNIRRTILTNLDASLASLTTDNGYNFSAGVNVFKDFKPTSKITGSFPCCYSKLGLSDPKEVGNSLKKKVQNQSYKTVDCYIGIAVAADPGMEGSLRDELERAIEDLEDFVNMNKGNKTLGITLYDVQEVVHVTPPKSTPFYDNGAISGWAVTQFQIKYKDFN